MPGTTDVLKLENQLCFPLYAASREVIKLYKPKLDELGLTYTQYITMMVLWERERLTVRELGERLFLDSGTLTPLLKKLEQKGFITRERSAEDERALDVRLTEEGRGLRAAALSVPESVGRCIPLSPEEGVTLYGLLYKILGKTDRQ
ncbi:MAG: MarR family transcriptional regulator [Clostridia bacterium]|nr:MarR family transcriptional regulator [Clostridia bacterium]